MPDRRIPPPVALPRALGLPPAREWTLANGLRVVAIEGAKTPILRLELLFDAGRPFEQQRLVARATNQLLTEGTLSRTAADLESFFEYFGTSLRTPNVFDTGHLALYTILPHLERILPVVAEVIAEPAFGPADFSTYVKRSRQALREDLTDPDTIAYRHFTELVFGSGHPYGYNGYLEDYQQLRREDVVAHHKNAYGAANATLLLAGQVTPAVESLLDRYLGQLPVGQQLSPEKWSEQTESPTLWQLRRPRAQQTLIRRGRRLFTRNHADYPGVSVLNTIFGGYFGSRLMKNIREDKGFTYGIDSSIDFMRFGGYMTIAADVANENLVAVRREIDKEIDKLQQDLVGEAELDMVRAYLLGSLLTEMDGPMNVAERYQTSLVEAVEPAHFDRLIDTVRHLTPNEIRDLAGKYLGKKDDVELIVGGAKQLTEARTLPTHQSD